MYYGGLRKFIKRLLQGTLTLFCVVEFAFGGELNIRFIGNEGFEISDGANILLTDFPYQSGAFDYMQYSADELTPRKNALCLITHSHADHFDATLLSKIKCKVFGPAELLNHIGKELWLPLNANGRVTFGQFSILPIQTTHGNVGHFSYLVTWRDKKLYFTGDTDDLDSLLKQPALDFLFVSPWLFKRLSEEQQKTIAKKVVIYHHRTGEKIDCSSCIVPDQNQVIHWKVFFRL